MKTIQENYFRYVPIRKSDLDWGLYVTGAGCTKVPAGYDSYPLTPHPRTYDFSWSQGRKLPEYTAMYVAKGGGEFESTPTGEVQVGEGMLVVLFPDVWHRYRPSVQTGWDEYWVSFSGDWMDQLVERGVFSPQRPVLTLGNESTLLAGFKSLLGRLDQEVAGFPQLMAANTVEILASALAENSPESTESVNEGDRQVVTVDDRLVADALRLIWDQSQGDLTVADLEQQLPVTRRHLERRFRSALGHTIHDEILRCRMERARRLLSKTDLLMKEVAVAAGFPNADNMGRTFRRLERVSPKEYRQQAKQMKQADESVAKPPKTESERCFVI